MRPHLFRTSASIIALFTAPAALADVTAQEVWDNWKANMALYGEDGVTWGSETASGDTVTVTEFTFSADDGDSVFTSNIGTITFTENGDGTVSVTMQDSYPFEISESDGDAGVTLVVTQENMSITVSGDPEAMNYDVSADSYAITLDEIMDDEFTGTAEAFVRMNALTGSYQTDISDGSSTTFGFASNAIEFLADVTDPEEGNFLASGQLNDVTSTGGWSLPEGADIDDPDTFQDDFAFRGETNAVSSAFLFDFDLEGDTGNGSMQTGAFKLGGDINDETLDYVVSLADLAVSMQVPDLPFPVDVSMSLFENILKMPVAESEEAQPFNYRFALTDLAVSDQIWAMGDPAGQLPRDPATLILDITGMARVLANIMDDNAAIDPDTVPFEPESVSINTVQLSAVGVEVTADGGFTFDNTDVTTFDGIPRPEGEVTIGITGANALIDTLINMGLLPAEQATMGRMMMGMFTQPAGDDALTSKIEINDQGHVLANGQRIQ